jgi:hypothetical protein
MWWEITRTTADTNGEYLEAVNVPKAGFGGPPLHAHPAAEETYAVSEPAGLSNTRPGSIVATKA